jgi:hypothetical protein
MPLKKHILEKNKYKYHILKSLFILKKRIK